jgi:hypothetical protein
MGAGVTTMQNVEREVIKPAANSRLNGQSLQSLSNEMVHLVYPFTGIERLISGNKAFNLMSFCSPLSLLFLQMPVYFSPSPF